MPLTAQKLYDLVEHGAGAPDSRLDLWDVINLAGEALVTEYLWSWRIVGPEKMAAVAGQDWIEAPPAFGELLHLTVDGNSLAVRMVSPLEVMNLRQGQVTFTGCGTCLALAGNTPVPGGGEPRPRFLIYPTPASNGSPTFNVLYGSRWKLLDATRPDELVSVPREFHEPLIYKARAIGLNLNRQHSTIEESLYSDSIARLKAADQSRQPNFGPLRGGATDFPRAPVSNISGVAWSNPLA